MKQFVHIAAAGTWDHFHAGHIQFLATAFKLSRQVSIGITADHLALTKNFPLSLQAYKQRRQSITKFITQKQLSDKARIIKLDDIYGPGITDKTLHALLVTPKTLAGGQKVNVKRRQLGLSPLQLIKVSLKSAQDGGEVSSERIRAGKIDRSGFVYFMPFRDLYTYTLPRDLRAFLKKPFGRLVKHLPKPTLPTICVGDVTTKLFLDHHYPAEKFIVDLQVERQPLYRSLLDLGFSNSVKSVTVVNPAGTITSQLALAIRQHSLVLVKGEEDLAVIPAVLWAPLGWQVVYGQPGQGIVIVPVTEAKKASAYKLLSQFHKV